MFNKNEVIFIKEEKNKLDYFCGFRVTKELEKRIMEASKNEGKTKTDFIKSLILKALQEKGLNE